MMLPKAFPARVCVASVMFTFATASQAAVLPPITSSVADYEPRLTRPTGSNPGESFAIDSNIDTPSDAAELRIGGQSRFKFTGAFFFALPTFAPGDTVTTANLRFAQRPDASTIPLTFNADLRVLGITQDISESFDPDPTPGDTTPDADTPTINPALSPDLFSETDLDTRAGIGTLLGRVELQDNFVTPADNIATGGATTPRESSDAADALLAGYINGLIAEGIPAGSFLIVTLNPDGTPNDVSTNRYTFASANSAVEADRPTLTLDVRPVPEPGTIGILGAVGFSLLARRRRA